MNYFDKLDCQIIVISGPAGSGKSLLAKLIATEFEDDSVETIQIGALQRSTDAVFGQIFGSEPALVILDTGGCSGSLSTTVALVRTLAESPIEVHLPYKQAQFVASPLFIVLTTKPIKLRKGSCKTITLSA